MVTFHQKKLNLDLLILASLFLEEDIEKVEFKVNQLPRDSIEAKNYYLTQTM